MILNLGCGTKVSDLEDVINIDWSIFLRLKRIAFIQPFIPIFFKGERLVKYNSLSDNILVHNLNKGIPFEDCSVDVVFHSHVIEHIDRHLVHDFINETYRVLKPGGILRIVCPDLKYLIDLYHDSYSKSISNEQHARLHDKYIFEILEQCVRKEANGTSNQAPFRRWLENLVLGDARKRGETHQWMYDYINLKIILEDCFFKNVSKMKFNESKIKNWNIYKLETKLDNTEFKPHSLYIEAMK